MSVTIAEFRENINPYLDMVDKEDILIVKDGEIVAKLTYPRNKAVRGVHFTHKLTKRKNSEEIKCAIESFSGAICDNGITLSDYRAENQKKYENFA